MKSVPTVLLLSFVLGLSAQAQGLKGSPPCQRSASQSAPLIRGKSDKERWHKFLSIQPELIGMKSEQVEQALGYGKVNATKSELDYEIIESKYPSEPGTLATIELSVHLKNGTVHAYQVRAVHWGE